MPVGFQALTDNGVFQIDGETPCYQLVQSYPLPCTPTPLPTVYNNVGTQFGATFNYAQTPAFIAKRPLVAFAADGNVFACPWTFSGGDPNGALTQFTASFIAASQTTVRAWVFDQVPPHDSGFGLQVFDSNSVLIADAATPFARVIDVIQGAYVGGTGYEATGSTMPGENLQSRSYPVHTAIAACYPAHYTFDAGGGNGGETTMSGIAVNNFAGGSTVTWGFHTYAGSRGAHYIGFREASQYSFMVLDMTGLV